MRRSGKRENRHQTLGRQRSMEYEPIKAMMVRMAIDPCLAFSAHWMAQQPSDGAGQQESRDLGNVGPRHSIAEQPARDLFDLLERRQGREWHDWLYSSPPNVFRCTKSNSS
jgi:hypothetical protein